MQFKKKSVKRVHPQFQYLGASIIIKKNMPKHILGYIITSKKIDERLIDLKINYWIFLSLLSISS
jgi:hypothetical protein